MKKALLIAIFIAAFLACDTEARKPVYCEIRVLNPPTIMLLGSDDCLRAIGAVQAPLETWTTENPSENGELL